MKLIVFENTATHQATFGSPMPSRSFSASSYKYGFNGKEKDDEVKGEGNSLDFSGRMLDTRLGRWLTIDPKSSKYPSMSPFVGFANNPNYYIDPGGETLRVAGSDEKNLTIARNDLISLLPPGKAGKAFESQLKFENDGSVQFNVTEKEALASGDPGVMLLYNTVNSKNTYQYSVEQSVNFKLGSSDEIQKKEGVTNAPSEPKYSGGIISSKSPAEKGVDALVNIPSTLKMFNEDGTTESRPSIVFHELQESYSVQDEKILYFSKTDPRAAKNPTFTGPLEKYPEIGAHDKAINIAKESFKPGDPRYDADPGKGAKTEQ